MQALIEDSLAFEITEQQCRMTAFFLKKKIATGKSSWNATISWKYAPYFIPQADTPNFYDALDVVFSQESPRYQQGLLKLVQNHKYVEVQAVLC